MNVCHLGGLALEPLDLEKMLTEAEQPKLPEFRERTDDLRRRTGRPLLDDLTLIRFMRADCCDLDKAEARLRKTLAWRAEKGVDDVLAQRHHRAARAEHRAEVEPVGRAEGAPKRR